MPEMDFDWDGLIRLLARNLYSEKRIFVRELIQNAHDAVLRRRHDEPGFGGRIDIRSDTISSTITFRDDGYGMDREDLVAFLSTVGKGATALARNDSVHGLVGQFGIGFLSAFVVADKVEVRTRKVGEKTGWLWRNSGSRTYEIEQFDSIDRPGTTVTVYVQRTEVGILQPPEISEVVTQYADMLLVPIYIDDTDLPTNTMRMPWEQKHLDRQATELDCRNYLERRMQDSVLEVIPFDLKENHGADGVLYISAARAIGVDAPRTVQIYLNRMFVSGNVPEILPRWASFVNGVINSTSLEPTAARDNIVRSPEFDLLRERLGDLIVCHFERIRDTNPGRFSEILKFHALRIRAACLAYPEFFAKFSDLLEWRVNAGVNTELPKRRASNLLTMREILARLPNGENAGARRLLCFESGNVDHFFNMATSVGAVVVDASDVYEMELLASYPQQDGANFQIVRVDREDAEELFQPLKDSENGINDLAQAMSTSVELPHTKLTVSARCFAPASLPAILRNSAEAEHQERARRLYHDPSVSGDVRELASAIMGGPPTSMKLTINGNNGFIQRLARIGAFTDKSVGQLMLAIYNSAFLTSGAMTAHNAKVLHGDFVSLMERSLELLERSSELDQRLRQLGEMKMEQQQSGGGREKADHRVFFLITPYSSKYEGLRDAVREVVEDRWRCQLYMASDRKYDDSILGSVRKHMWQADAFIAEVTDANPNVMFELGAAFADRRDRPIIQLLDGSATVGTNGKTEKLPSNLSSMIYIDYEGRVDEDLVNFLEKEMRKDVTVEALVSDEGRVGFVSWRCVYEYTQGIVSEEVCRRIAAEIATEERWKCTTSEELEALVGSGEPFLLKLVLERVQRGIGG